MQLTKKEIQLIELFKTLTESEIIFFKRLSKFSVMLPCEIKLKILHFLEQPDLLCLAMVNIDWRCFILENASQFAYLLLKGRSICFTNDSIFLLLTHQMNHLHTLSRLEKLAHMPPIYKISQSLESIPVLQSPGDPQEPILESSINIQHCTGHTDRIVGVSVARVEIRSEIETFVVAISDDRSFSIWQNSTADKNSFKMLLRKRLTSSPSCADISASAVDSKISLKVAFGFFNGNIRLLRLFDDYKSIDYIIGNITHPSPVTSILIKQNMLYFGGEDGQVASINLKNKVINTLQIHLKPVSCLFSMKNSLFSGSYDGKVCLLNHEVTEYSILAIFSAIYSIHGSNSLIYVAMEQGVSVFHWKNGKLQPHLKFKSNDIVTSPGTICKISCDGDFTFLSSTTEIIIMRSNVVYSRFRYAEYVKKDSNFQKERLVRYTDLLNDSASVWRGYRISSFAGLINGIFVGGADSILRIFHYNSKV
eukprot:NODE_674_length_4836_cov_1.077686.p1 type:complete len:478 gc:universal NODE_674_length_4836_cov_1.077686:3404-1971(-)